MANKEIKKYPINKQALYSLMKEHNVTVKELGTTYYDRIQRTPSTINRYLEIEAMPLEVIENIAWFFEVNPNALCRNIAEHRFGDGYCLIEFSKDMRDMSIDEQRKLYQEINNALSEVLSRYFEPEHAGE